MADPLELTGAGHGQPADGPRRGALPRRLLRHHLPLALASGVALVLFMNVPFFDANRYSPPGAIFTEGIKGAFPDGGGTGAPNG
ncbi:MAG: hypothetical protein H0V33_10780, partial [Acidimicrobiia bacterium]|nr:hypothetical protein [Acidimicrobiia bacterium]